CARSGDGYIYYAMDYW
nr:immunoglobulin heavy chain junction region [Mus musculus]